MRKDFFINPKTSQNQDFKYFFSVAIPATIVLLLLEEGIGIYLAITCCISALAVLAKRKGQTASPCAGTMDNCAMNSTGGCTPSGQACSTQACATPTMT